MDGLLAKFQQHLQKEYPFLSANNSSLLLAVSGGVDSIVLTHLFKQSGYNIVMAHCNFTLRGQESDRDEQFVTSFGRLHNIAVLVKRFETEQYARQHKLSIQEAARELRYAWFREIVKSESSIVSDESSALEDGMISTNESEIENNKESHSLTPHPSPFTPHHPSYTVTAHHANDNIETLLINFFRGTGMAGLHGIPARHDNILRPLLFAKREEILAYAKQNGLGWVEDSSNASDKYTRNFIRLKLLPLAKEVFANVDDNLLQNINRFKEAETLYNQAVDNFKSKLVEQKGNERHIPVLKLKKAGPLQTIVWEITRQFGFTTGQLPEILKLLDADNGAYISSATHRIIKNRQWLIIAPKQSEAVEHILIEEGDSTVMFENGVLEVDTLTNPPSTHPHSPTTTQPFPSSAMLDLAQIRYPLMLRKWKQGDYFYPLGMQKKKKLSRFFIDQKLSKTDKEKIWVLESDKRILWVVGLRIDDRFKITPSCKKTLFVKFTGG